MGRKVKEEQKKFVKGKKSFILLILLCLGVGFALLSSNLRITGNTTVTGNKWSVYFDNVQVSNGSVEASVVPTVVGTTTTSLDYAVLLDKPGDFYEFTVDAVNDGTIDAMVESIILNNSDTNVAKVLNYTATYEYGAPIKQNDVLQKQSTTTYKVRVEYKSDADVSSIGEEGIDLTLTFGINYAQSTVVSEFAKLVKKNALSDTGLNFTENSSESNGRGLYVMNSTKNNSYPIYYYRGAVSNNNAKFAGFCWRIVRTTETGGTKLVYNGLPDGEGHCSNTTGNATQLASTSAFNENKNLPAYVGYMYGTVYEYESGTSDTSHVYGNTFTYSNGMYTLSGTHAGVDGTHHYTCLSASNSCESIKYVYYANDSGDVFYITLTNGKSIEDALIEMQTNTTSSTIKTRVDNWFNNTFKTYFTTNEADYNDYLEDTIWCNDRSMNTIDTDGNGTYTNNAWKPNGGSKTNFLYYSAFGRRDAGTPSLACSNKNDSFTVEETETGNGSLTYPVGLLTSDEVILAGSTSTNSTDHYLYTNQYWWTMSADYFYLGSAREFLVYAGGKIESSDNNNSNGVRPSISLKPGVKIAAGGDGSSATPYEFVLE